MCQGGAVAQALQGTGFHLRGLTRKPDSERAAALARHYLPQVGDRVRTNLLELAEEQTASR